MEYPSIYTAKKNIEDVVIDHEDRIAAIERALHMVVENIPDQKTEKVDKSVDNLPLKEGVTITKNGRYMLHGRMIKASEAFQS